MMNSKMLGMGSEKNGVHTVTLANKTTVDMSCEQIIGWLAKHNIKPPAHCSMAVDSKKQPPSPPKEEKVELWAPGVDVEKANATAIAGPSPSKKQPLTPPPTECDDKPKKKSSKKPTKKQPSKKKKSKEPELVLDEDPDEDIDIIVKEDDIPSIKPRHDNLL